MDRDFRPVIMRAALPAFQNAPQSNFMKQRAESGLITEKRRYSFVYRNLYFYIYIADGLIV